MDYKDFMNVKNWFKNKPEDKDPEIVSPEAKEPEKPAEILSSEEKPKATRKPRTTKKVADK